MNTCTRVRALRSCSGDVHVARVVVSLVVHAVVGLTLGLIAHVVVVLYLEVYSLQLMHRRRAFPIASASVIQANSRQATPHARLSLSWGHHKVSPTQHSGKRVISLGSLATPEYPNLVHASLCAHVELVTPIRCADRRLSCRLDLSCICSPSQQSISQAKAGLDVLLQTPVRSS